MQRTFRAKGTLISCNIETLVDFNKLLIIQRIGYIFCHHGVNLNKKRAFKIYLFYLKFMVIKD